MKTIYRPKEKTRKRRVELLVFAALILSSLGIFLTPLKGILRETIDSMAVSVFRGEENIASALFGSIGVSNKNLLAENETLRNQLEDMKIALLEKNIVEKENAELRELLNAKKEGEHVIAAAVLGKPNRSPYDTILLDAGENLGVARGMTIVVGSSTPLGKVVEVTEKTALVRLFSSPGEETPVLIGDKRIEALALGVGGGNFRVLLPKDTGVSEGDSIWLSGESRDSLGTIERIEKSDSETLARIFFKTPVSIYSLSHVLIRSH